MKTVKIVLDEATLQTMGGSSLIGMVHCIYKEETGKFAWPAELQLEFPQSTIEWKRATGDIRAICVWEHTIPCLIADVVALIEAGVRVEITMPADIA